MNKSITLRPTKIYNLGFQIVITILLFSFLQTVIYADPPSSTTQGGRPAGSYNLDGFDNINLFNGNLNFKLPLLKVGGRGDVNFTIPFIVEQRWIQTVGWVGQLQVYQYFPEGGAGVGANLGDIEDATTTYNYWQCTEEFEPSKAIVAFNFKTVDGTTQTFHPTSSSKGLIELSVCPGNFRPITNVGAEFETWDGSGAKLIADYPIYHDGDFATMRATPNGQNLTPVWTLLFPNGTRYRIEPSGNRRLEDRNGNYINFTNTIVNSAGVTFTKTDITDSLGRTVTIDPSQNEFPYGEHTKITYQGFGGATRIIRASRSKIWLPDGRTYNFTYNSNYELTKVETPTSGSFEYSWDGNIPPPTEPGQTPNDAPFRYITERRVYGDGVNLTSKQTFSVPSSITQVDTYDSSNNLLSRSKHYFNGNVGPVIPPANPSWIYAADQENNNLTQGKEYKTEFYASNGTTLLRKNQINWQSGRTVTWSSFGEPTQNISINARVSSNITTLADSNQVSKIEYWYNQGIWATASYNVQTDVFEYDYAVNTPGSFLRRTHTEYLQSSAYTTGLMNILNILSETWVSSDINGNSKVSRTVYEYDNYASDTNHAPLVQRSNITGHNSSYGTSYTTRGNVTKVTSYADAQNQTGVVSVHTQYDIAGNVVKAIDAKGNVSTISYNDNFGSPDAEARFNSAPGVLNGQQTFAFATSATNVAGYTTYAQFDYFTGAGVDAEDINGNVSTIFYSDILDRPTQTIGANNRAAFRSQTTFIYDDANRKVTIIANSKTFGDNLLKSESFYDGLGRTTESRSYETGSNYIAALQEYDALGRAYKSSNPFRPYLSEQVQWTETKLDDLGRVIEVKTPDNAKVTRTYSGNSVRVYDQALRSRAGITDALGRLTKVIEYNNGADLETFYTYDVLGRLRKTVQDAQSRYFMYDDLGRLIRAKQTEQIANSSLSLTDPVTGNTQWSVKYVYDNNGNITSTTDANNRTITGTYDNLNRLTFRDYSDGAMPGVTFTFDNPTIANSKGQLTAVTSSVSQTYYTAFDQLSRIKSSSQVTNNQTYNFPDYSYDLSGALIAQAYPSGRVVRTETDAIGRLSKVPAKCRISLKEHI